MAEGYIARHWRGELTLPVSFWINNGLLSFPIGLAIGGLAAWITIKGDYLRGGSIALLLAWPTMLLFSVWCVVGAWRAATAHAESGGSTFWAMAAKGVLLLSALSTLASVTWDFLPNVGAYLRMARGIDPIGHLQATLSADGRRLRLEGPIGMGDSVRVRALTAKAAGLRIIELDSPGGRLKEGEDIAHLVRSAAWQTRTTGACESACTLIHMAGQRRQLLPGAKLGFHRASSGSLNPMMDGLANRELTRIYREAGLPESFIERTLATPASRMWHPSRDELVHAGLVSVGERPLDVDLPESAKAPASEYADAMTASDTWLAVERRFPGAMEAGAKRMAEARGAGAAAEEVQVQGQKVIEQHLPALLAAAGPELRDSYMALLAAQMGAVRGSGPAAPAVAPATVASTPSACISVLAADTAARRGLSADLVQREAAWLIAAATAEPTRELGGRAASAVEQEVLRRRLGERSPALLAQAWQPGALQRPARDCEKTLELLRAVAALPAAERRLATRMMFGRG